MKNDNFYMLAKTMFGLEEILAEELRKLGAQDVKPMNRAVSFKGDKGFMYKANLNARTALRILKPIAHFQAHDEKELYSKLCEIDWTEIFDLEATFATHATTHSEVFTHSKYASLVMKDAIADTFRKKFDKRPNVDPETPDVSINLHIAKHTCTVSLDSSGDSLHKRGYKSDAVVAPMNEVLAAGLILLSDWNRIANFHDPMCGSGTLLIEATLIAHNIPANIFRAKFGFESWKDFDQELWDMIKEVSLEKETHYYGKITGSDNFQMPIVCQILAIGHFPQAPQPIQAATSNALSAFILGIGNAFASCVFPEVFTETKPPDCWILSNELLSTIKSLITGIAAERQGSI